MLKKINEGGVESENEFSIQIVQPDYLEYKEGKIFIPISLAYEPKTKKIYIYVSNNKKLDIIDKKRVANHLREAVKLLKGNFEVV